MSAKARVSFIHLPTVAGDTGLCGFTIDTRRGSGLSGDAAPLSSFVLSSYCTRFLFKFSGKKTSLGGPERLVLVNPGIQNSTPQVRTVENACPVLWGQMPGWHCSVLAEPPSSETDLSATNPAILRLMKNSTVSTLHTELYLGAGGLLLNIPCSNLHTSGCCPTGWPSIGGNVADRADRADL